MTPRNDSGRLLTISETAEILKLSERTVRRKIHSGDMAAHRLGRTWRIARRDLEDYLRSHREGVDRDVL